MSKELMKLARASLDKIDGNAPDGQTKESFIPMPGGQPPPPDPAMAAGAGGGGGGGMGMAPPPMDPAMMAGGGMMPPAGGMMPPAGGMMPPVDPSMAGAVADPSIGQPPPAEGVPAGPPPEIHDMLVNAVRQVMQEMGVTGEDGENGKDKPKKPSTGSRLDAIEKALAGAGVDVLPDNADQGNADQQDKAPASAGMGMAAGQPSDGAGAVSATEGAAGLPLPAGPMDPNMGAAITPGGGMGAIGGVSMMMPRASVNVAIGAATSPPMQVSGGGKSLVDLCIKLRRHG